MTDNTEARERVLEAAEKLFAERGYSAVTLRDIASAVGIKHASLYHHVPGGKEELYIEVSERNFKRHYTGLTQAIQGANPDVQSRLRAVADWLLAQPPMDLIRMVHSDMPSIPAAKAAELSELAFVSVIRPIEAALREAEQQGEIQHNDLGLIAGGILGMVESLHSVPSYILVERRQNMAYTLLDTMLLGLRPRQEASPDRE